MEFFFLAGHRYGLKFYNTLAIKSGGENKYFVYTFLNQNPPTRVHAGFSNHQQTGLEL